uniref:Selectin P n=1 Tax=Hucho hucho TaxID=62062 RepID=A0A4W5L6Y9_9TELE
TIANYYALLYRNIQSNCTIQFDYYLTGETGSVQAWTYNYSVTQNLDWDSARQWCRQHYTDMVAIQNQEEIVYLNTMLPRNSQYYWIGLRKVNEMWTWMGTNKTLTKEAENWATGEPNNIGHGQDCVEIYIKRGKDEAKWNDERCTRKKGPLCYTASCSKHCCSSHAECLENIGNYTCKCDPGFKGPRCHEAVACDAVSDPDQGSVNCDHPHGLFAFNSSCQFHCALGYQLLGASQLLCQATGFWDHPAAQCQVKQCPHRDSGPHRGTMNCSDPIALHSYNSTCEFSCDLGFDLIGPDRIQCDHTGQWTGNISTCTVVRCGPLSPPAMGNMSCVDPLGASSFTSSCGFSCEEGYLLRGDINLTCLSTGQWTNRTPACERALFIKKEYIMNEFSYDSTCTLECEKSFLGPVCHNLCPLYIPPAQKCAHLSPPAMGNMSCVDPLGHSSFTSSCGFSCEEGYLLRGDINLTCLSTGQWTNHTPACEREVVQVEMFGPCMHHGSWNNSGPGFYQPGWHIGYAGKILGALSKHEVSTALQDQGCLLLTAFFCSSVRHCSRLVEPQRGWMNCTHPYSPYSYSSHCLLQCNEGFWLTGAPTMHCNALGVWSQDLPSCQVVQCENLFSSLCLFTCSKGYYLNGTEELSCTSEGQWSDLVPSCQRNITSVQGCTDYLFTSNIIYNNSGIVIVLVLYRVRDSDCGCSIESGIVTVVVLTSQV